MPMIKSHKHAPPNVQVAFIRLKHAIHGRFIQLREFEETNLGTFV